MFRLCKLDIVTHFQFTEQLFTAVLGNPRCWACNKMQSCEKPKLKASSRKKSIPALLRVAKLHLNEPQDFWNNVLPTDETKCLDIMHSAAFGKNQTQRINRNTSYQLSARRWWGDGFGFFCSHWTWAAYICWSSQVLLSCVKYFFSHYCSNNEIMF